MTIRRRSEPSTTVSGVTYEWCYRGWVRTMEVGKLEVYLESEWEVVPSVTWVEVTTGIVDGDESGLRITGSGARVGLPHGYRWKYEMDCAGASRLVVQRRVAHE